MDCGYPHNLTLYILAWSLDHEISQATVVRSCCRRFSAQRYADRPERTATPATPAERTGCIPGSAASADRAGYAYAPGPAARAERTEYAARPGDLDATRALCPTDAPSCRDAN
jgi:hypothetical protein